MIQKIVFLFLIVVVFQSCNSVKEYEKVAINDPDMKLLFRFTERLRLEPMEGNLVAVAVVINC